MNAPSNEALIYGRDVLAEVAASMVANMAGHELLSLTDAMDHWRTSLINDEVPGPPPTTDRREAVEWRPFRDETGAIPEEVRDHELSKAGALIAFGAAIVAASGPNPSQQSLNHLKQQMVPFCIAMQDGLAAYADACRANI